MKPEENNFEKNISRLVKLTGDSNKPNEAFIDSLTEQAIGELEQGKTDRAREKEGINMKAKWPKILAYAASIVIIGGLAIALMMPRLNHCKRFAKRVTASTEQVAYMTKTDSELVAGDYKASDRSKIQYTEVAKERAYADVKVKSDNSVAQVVDRFVAKDYKPSSPAEMMHAEGTMRGGDVQRLNERERSDNAGVAGKIPAYPDVSTKYGVEKKEAKVVAMLEQSLNADTVRASEPACCPRPMPERCPAGYPMAHGGVRPPNGEDVDAMFFKNYGVNPFVDTEDDHLSTFATDVDTGSYTVVRGYLHDGHLPPPDAVRVEEFVNYFRYGYAAPQKDDFAVYAEATPWQFGEGRKNSYLSRLGLKGKQISEENRQPAVLTFVIDVSGSMQREDRLGLVKQALRMLVERLKPEDRIGIAVYGSRGRKVMDYKGLDEKEEILTAIEMLCAGGSTYAEEGIRIGYQMAAEAYKKGYINRVILCSDGVANVGQTGADDILKVIKEKAEKGITLSAIGFGMGNYNDVLMERLGDAGNGHYVYIDTITEAKRIFEDNLTGTLQVIARDVKVQVDFNPKVVRSYRLIGYENRDVPDEKFRDDKYDGGEVGAGHCVTALYELKLWPDKEGTAATTYVRYKDADSGAVTEFKSSLGTSDFSKGLDDSSSDFRLAATAAEFAEILRKSYWAKGATLDSVLERAQQLSREFNNDSDVIELVDLISKAKGLMKKTEVKPIETEYEAGTSQEP